MAHLQVTGSTRTPALASPTAPANRAVNAAGSPQLYLQAGAFSQRDNAEELQGRIVTALPYTVRINDSNDYFYKVQVGPFVNDLEIDEARVRLTSLGIRTSREVID